MEVFSLIKKCAWTVETSEEIKTYGTDADCAHRGQNLSAMARILPRATFVMTIKKKTYQ
jgi:hypothetical protein